VRNYLDLLRTILDKGDARTDRTGVGTISHFGAQLQYDLNQGFPLVTSKKVHWKSVVHELLWFLKGSTNIHYLTDNGVTIWNEWADEKGDLGPIYGKQWRSWPTSNQDSIDQIKRVLHSLQHDPYSRRHVISAWNVGELDKMALAPCHIMFQFYVAKGCLSCHLYQRSADAFLGVPFNIASYALLTSMMSQVLDLKPGKFVHSFGDVHIYNTHLSQVEQQLARTPKVLPGLKLNPRVTDLFEFDYDDCQLERYDPHPPISAPVAI
jgi:thymidylate synthase